MIDSFQMVLLILLRYCYCCCNYYQFCCYKYNCFYQIDCSKCCYKYYCFDKKVDKMEFFKAEFEVNMLLHNYMKFMVIF